MTKTLPLSEVKANLSHLVHDVQKRDDAIIITRNGRPAAVIWSIDEYERWKETQEIKNDPELMKGILKGIDEMKKGKFKSYSSADEFIADL